MSKGICPIEDCGRPTRKRGYCNRHYENLRLTGNPVPKRDQSLEDRVHGTGWTVMSTGCWEWRGSRNENGYGIVNVRRQGAENARAHRVVYELAVGPIPEGLVLRHSCDNPPCVNPEHLTPGTHADNSQDMVERGRHWAHGRTACNNGHDLTAPGAIRIVRRTRGEEKNCVECARARQRRYEERQHVA
jgi:HNH endonuclease